jgi:threonine dehydrogenase-like Zn-dependent dehydrogenase
VIAIVGAGVTGARVLEQLIRLGHSDFLLHDREEFRAEVLAAKHRSAAINISVVRKRNLVQAHVVVLACGAPHNELALSFVQAGAHVVSMSDDVDDTTALLDLNDLATQNNRLLVVGAAASPGLTGLLLAHLATQFDSIDEAHVAVHGTGGPDCEAAPLCFGGFIRWLARRQLAAPSVGQWARIVLVSRTSRRIRLLPGRSGRPGAVASRNAPTTKNLCAHIGNPPRQVYCAPANACPAQRRRRHGRSAH